MADDDQVESLEGKAHQIMAHWYPTRRNLGSPAWLWVVLAVSVFLLSNLPTPKGDFLDPNLDDRPSEVAEPLDRGEIANEQLTVAREGDSFRFVPASERNALEEAARYRNRIVRLWRVLVVQRDKEETISCGASYFLPGLIRRE
jgi:hypothetical protein